MKRRDLLKGLAAGATTLGALTTEQIHLNAAAVTRTGTSLDQDGVKYWSETSLNRVYPNSPVGSAAPLALSTCRNAQLSFQVCFRHQKDCSIRVRAEVSPPDGWTARVRRVGYVPIQQLDTDVPLDETDGVGHVPGLVPDPLYPEQTAHVGPESNAAFWITLRVPPDAKVGVTRLKVALKVEDEFRFPGWTGTSEKGVELPIDVDVRPLVLNERKDFPVTQWISIDSIWEYYKIPPFSDRFWQLADAYVADMTAHNVNVIYCPVFNARHEILERPAQLVRVRSKD
jgi:hypothetical protein